MKDGRKLSDYYGSTASDGSDNNSTVPTSNHRDDIVHEVQQEQAVLATQAATLKSTKSNFKMFEDRKCTYKESMSAADCYDDVIHRVDDLLHKVRKKSQENIERACLSNERKKFAKVLTASAKLLVEKKIDDQLAESREQPRQDEKQALGYIPVQTKRNNLHNQTIGERSKQANEFLSSDILSKSSSEMNIIADEVMRAAARAYIEKAKQLVATIKQDLDPSNTTNEQDFDNSKDSNSKQAKLVETINEQEFETRNDSSGKELTHLETTNDQEFEASSDSCGERKRLLEATIAQDFDTNIDSNSKEDVAIDEKLYEKLSETENTPQVETRYDGRDGSFHLDGICEDHSVKTGHLETGMTNGCFGVPLLTRCGDLFWPSPMRQHSRKASIDTSNDSSSSKGVKHLEATNNQDFGTSNNSSGKDVVCLEAPNDQDFDTLKDSSSKEIAATDEKSYEISTKTENTPQVEAPYKGRDESFDSDDACEEDSFKTGHVEAGASIGCFEVPLLTHCGALFRLSRMKQKSRDASIQQSTFESALPILCRTKSAPIGTYSSSGVSLIRSAADSHVTYNIEKPVGSDKFRKIKFTKVRSTPVLPSSPRFDPSRPTSTIPASSAQDDPLQQTLGTSCGSFQCSFDSLGSDSFLMSHEEDFFDVVEITICGPDKSFDI